MKKGFIIACLLITFVCLIPFPSQAKDGGTIHYDAILYDVYDVHRISLEEGKDFDEGIIVKICDVEVFNNVK
ncbi:MAG: hypothetical protein J6V22_05595 [Clostridia bacterium]|nr:hypothetical protein [Clostridia bacterium]